ncbi:hypothetical protein PspLS_10290 [Pyricularia sp. CBS 133598]|nr:hypothetical protein PspLS_10290 [Pyricularia sp. CBS 133598]
MYFASEFVYFSAAGAMLSAAVTGLANSPYYRPQIDSNNRGHLNRRAYIDSYSDCPDTQAVRDAIDGLATVAPNSLLSGISTNFKKRAVNMGNKRIGIGYYETDLANKWKVEKPQETFYIYHLDEYDAQAYGDIINYLTSVEHPIRRDQDPRLFTEKVYIPWSSIMSYTEYVPGKQPKTTENKAWVPNGGRPVEKSAVFVWHIRGKTVYTDNCKPRWQRRGQR